nr:NAD-dependent epimerase/dehydratase family protein [Pacificimonas pallii]
MVTGANGLIGANLLRSLIRKGHQALGLVRATSDVSYISDLPAPLSIGDVTDIESLARAMSGCDVVFHTAVHFSYWGHDNAAMQATAVDGTRNVIRAAQEAGVRRVVITSSSVTLGAGLKPIVRNEGDVADPDDAGQPGYVGAKIAQEIAAADFAGKAGVEVVFALPTMSVGAYGSALGPSNGVITSYLADPLKLSWAGGCNIVAVQDVADGHLLLAERGAAGGRYILGSENLTWLAIHTMIAQLAGVEPPRHMASALTCQIIAAAEEVRALVTGRAPLATRTQAAMVGRYYWYDHGAAAALGYRPQSARDALAGALAWLSAGPHVSRETRINMRLDRKVHAARAARHAAERTLEREAV